MTHKPQISKNPITFREDIDSRIMAKFSENLPLQS